MATVPYSPIPQASASGSGLPQVSANVPEAAFGGEVARAISGLGKTVEGVGDQLMERALWLQNLNNQAEARKADADYIIRSGQLHAEYNSLEGDAAVKAYPKYVQNLKALRESIKGSLSTRASQDLFDGETRGTMARAVFSASSHAATAQKKYVIQTMDAQRTAIREEAAQYPFDDTATERAVRRTEASVAQEGQLRGLPPEAIDNAKREATSAIWASKIESAAKENPLQAPTMLSTNRHRLVERDFKRVENVVNNQRDAYGSAKIATDLLTSHTDEDGNLTVPMAEIQAKARGLAEQFSPDDPAFATKTVKALDAEFNQRKYARKVQNYDNRDVVNNAILTGASSMDMLLSDPKAAAAYYALPKAEQLKVPGRINEYIKRRDEQFNQRTYTTIMGLKNNDVESFLNIDPTDEKYKLAQSQVRQVMEAQAKVKKQVGNDPRVDRYMRVMRDNFASQMQTLNVFRRSNSNKDEYDHLTGAVQESIDLWMAEHKKPPSEKEFKEQIAPSLLKETSSSWGNFLESDDAFWRLAPFKGTPYRHDTWSKAYIDYTNAKKAEIKAKGGSDPSEDELYKAYTRYQLEKLFPTRKTKEPPT